MKMDAEDFSEIFDYIDTVGKGYISLEQLHNFHSLIFDTRTDIKLIHVALIRICGNNSEVLLKEHFIDVLEEIERRRQVKTESYWDFQSLDYFGTNKISLKDAFLLFQEYHRDRFSLVTWKEFLQSRDNSEGDVCFDEIWEWLCDPPDNVQASSRKDIEKEQARLQNYSMSKAVTLDEEPNNVDERQENTLHHANRKLNKWKSEGLSALLNDDGLSGLTQDVLLKRQGDAVSTSDVINALKTKYRLLQDKLLMEMASSVADFEEEKSEIYEEMKSSIAKQPRNEAFLDNINKLPGATCELPLSLLALIGDLSAVEAERVKEFKEISSKLSSEGRSESEVWKFLEKHYNEVVDGTKTCGSILHQLTMREKSERESLLASVQAHSSIPSWVILNKAFFRLKRQISELSKESNFMSSALVSGLFERQQILKPKRFHWDEKRSQILATRRLVDRESRDYVKTCSQIPDLESIKSLNLTSAKLRLLEELEQKHRLEREVLISFLQTNEENILPESVAKMSEKDKNQRLSLLGHQRNEWKSSSGGDASINTRILREATYIYLHERKSDMEKFGKSSTYQQLKSVVLSDLQLRQEVEFHTLVEDLHKKDHSSVLKLLLTEIETIKEEHLDNIAFVTIGNVEIAEEDQIFLDTLHKKYKSLRDQIFVFCLQEKFGLQWSSLTKEEKQKEINEYRKEEKLKRGEGNFDAMKTLLGSISQSSIKLASLCGPEKVFNFNEIPSQKLSEESSNMLSDLNERNLSEKEQLVSWLQTETVQSMLGRVRRREASWIDLERFAASCEANYETAFIYVGLLERLRLFPFDRSSDDVQKQLLLAQKRATARMKIVKQGEKIRNPSEEKFDPKSDDFTGWQQMLLRSTMRNHFKERESLLQILQDQGVEELVEAAKSFTQEQAVLRLRELQTKRKNLALEMKENQVENFNILEEAGAIRAALKQQTMCEEFERTVLLDQVVTALLAELQDIQDVQLANVYQQLNTMEISELQEKSWTEKKLRLQGQCENVMSVFTKVEGQVNQEHLLKLVNEKYSALRKHFIEENLHQEKGKEAFRKMKQKEKQKLMSDSEIKEQQFWTEGTEESLSTFACDNFSIHPSFAFLAGASRQDSCKNKRDAEIMKQDDNLPRLEDSGGRETYIDLHRRYFSEINFVQNLDSQPSYIDKRTLKNYLSWEEKLCSALNNFKAALLAVGLSERFSQLGEERWIKDQLRYKLIGQELMNNKIEEQPLPETRVDLNRYDLQENIVECLLSKATKEWKFMQNILQNSAKSESVQVYEVKSKLQLENRLKILRKNREELPLSEKSKQYKILEEAIVVQKAIQKRYAVADGTIAATESESVSYVLMGELFQSQLAEFYDYTTNFMSQSAEDLKVELDSLREEVTECHVDNVAKVAFGLLQKNEENQEANLKSALEGKYDAMKDQILIQALINQMGEADWNRLSEKERQKRLLELKLKHRQLLQEGKINEANALIGQMLKDDEQIKNFIFGIREKQENRLKEKLAKRKQRLAEGMTENECKALEEKEKLEEKSKINSEDVFFVLDDDHDKRKEQLMKNLNELKDSEEKEHFGKKETIRLCFEEQQLRNEDQLNTAALVFALSNSNGEITSDADIKKDQDELAKERLETSNEIKREESMEEFALNDGDPNSVIKLMEKTQNLERNALAKLLQAIDNLPIRDEARIHSNEDLWSSFLDVKELFNLWNERTTKSLDDRDQILEAAAAYCVELTKRRMVEGGEASIDEHIKISLMVKLQQMQIMESRDLTSAMTEKISSTKALFQKYENRLKEGSSENLARVLFSVDKLAAGVQEDKNEEIVTALEKKYDAMRDKLLMEALIKEMGEANWKRLTELERQKKLVEIKMKERQLRREGKLDQVNELLGKYAKDTEGIQKYLTESQEENQRRIREKILLRKRMKGKGTDEGENMVEDSLENQDGGFHRKNVLENLSSNFDEEKAAILSGLGKYRDKVDKERERQKALAKLKREEKSLKQEANAETAALLFSLGQKQDRQRQESLCVERQRQKDLAKQRIEARRKLAMKDKVNGPSTEEKTDENLSDMSNENCLEHNILTSMEHHQTDERNLLLTIIYKLEHKSGGKTLSKITDESLHKSMTKLEKELQDYEKKVKKNMAAMWNSKSSQAKKEKVQNQWKERYHHMVDLLEKLGELKFELEKRKLSCLEPSMNDNELFHEVAICAMADLQEKQLVELEVQQNALASKTVDELRGVRKIQKAINKEGWYKTLSLVLLSVSSMEGELTTKLKTIEELDAEFERKKKEILEKGQRENLDVSGLIQDLESQFANKKEALKQEMESQEERLKQRLKVRRQVAAENNFEINEVLAGQVFSEKRKSQEHQKNNQTNLLQQKLKARQNARMAAARNVQESGESLDVPSLGASRSASPSMFGLSREKTVVDVHVSEDEKQAVYNMLVKQERHRRQQITDQQHRQEEMLKRKLAARSQNIEEEAGHLFSLGQRQKTVLEQSQKDERQRQIAQMQEKMSRIKRNRTQSPKKRASPDNE